ncbi:flagellar hook protein FlgE [Ahrensia sp. 13_GOM-1096m]|uniref:flagellar hook protein FlgE n=1 Tax=Ahrensia sp. 13_GOM-1096m TaxID=1380380 RepID=UPI00047AFBFD|nr:flagellar hook protein FlgE [Ahrensia sp. 13_GOM-1096m]
MSVYGMMRTGVSGMEGQANRLAATADNIANSSTTGYKRYETLFSTQVVNQSVGGYASGGVTTTSRQLVSQQGVLSFTTSTSDLALEGNGFFVVQDQNGVPQLTRAGSFVPNSKGELVNAAGFKLLGYSYDNGEPAAVANGFQGLVPVTVAQTELVAVPSTLGKVTVNLNSNTAVSTSPTPASNDPLTEFSNKTSLVAYDNLGGTVLLDVYYTKTAANTWEVTVYDQSGASSGTGFPYASGPLTTDTLSFDPSTGQMTGASPTSLTIPVPGGATLALDISKTTQLATGFLASDAEVNGNIPSSIELVQIGEDGRILGAYADGSTRELFRIPIATVASPDQMRSKTGNIFTTTDLSGEVSLGFANEGGNGKIVSGALENSTVDIATELTVMIEAQRNYTANSKVFQTGSELTETVINLKR